MKTLLRRISAAACVSALCATTAALATPTISFTPGAFPATGSPVALSSTPAGLNISVTAAPTAGASIVNVSVSVNGVNIGIATGASPFVVNWVPTAAGNYTIAATVTDTSTITTGASASTNTATINALVTVNAARVATLLAPTNNSTLPQNSEIFLRSTATMTDGIVSKVDFILDPTGAATVIGTATQAPYNVAYTVTAGIGAHTLLARATATDGVTTFDSSTLNFIVSSPVGTRPTVAITAPSTGAFVATSVATTITVTASDADGFIPSTTGGGVTFYADGEPIGTDLTAPYSISWTPTTAKTYSLRALAIDDKGNTTLSSAVSVTATASLPTVAISAPGAGSTVFVGAATNVTASATPSTGASITQVAFFANGVAIGAPVTTAPFTVAWTPAAAGAFALTAQVTDSAGITVTSPAINVTASTPAPAVAITAPASGATTTVGVGTTVTANATASSGATITQVEFFANGVSIAVDTAIPYSIVWTPSTAGAVNLTAVATQTGGATATSTAIPVTVNGAAPTISITSPTAGTSVPVNTAATISATATPSTGATITQVVFFAGGIQIGAPVTTAPFSITWTPTTTGAASLSARVTDSTGATVLSSAVSVTVTASVPTVALTAPIGGATATVGSSVSLAATATASAGATVTRIDFLLSGSIVATALPPATTATWTPTTAGVASLQARVTDSTGATATSPATLVTVAAASAASVTLALAPTGTAIPVNSSRTLTATVTGSVGVSYVEFLYDGANIGTRTAPPYSIVFTAPNAIGPHLLVARAFDLTGAAITSSATSISITSPVGVAPLASILAPSSGAFLAAGVPTTISGTASDSDGSITGVQVYVNGATTGLANNGNATISGNNWSISWTPSGSGVASITALASDNSGNAVAAPALGVNITDSTSPAITLAFSPQVAGVQASTTLPSGAIRNIVANTTAATGRAVVRVEFFVDGTKVGEDTVAPYTFRYTAPVLDVSETSRNFVLSARATDNAGAARDAQVTLLVVSPVGQPPVVNLLTPANNASVFPNTAVSLAATAVATGGTISSVQFYVNGSPAGVNNGNAIAAAPYTSTFTPTTPGAYVIDAVATDDRGNTSISNSVTITAAFATPTIVFTAPNPNATARATPGVPLSLAAAATVQSGTGAAILLVEFLLDGVQIGADTTFPYTFSWIPTAAQLGQRVLTARVTDTNSQVAVSNPITVNVANVIGSPPTVSVNASPIPGGFGLQTVSTVNFVATAVATGAGSSLSNVEIYLNDISIGLAAREQTTNFYRIAYDLSRFDFTAITPNINDITGAVTYPVRLYAIARDTNGNQTVSATTNLIINPATSAPPSIQLVALTPLTITAGTQFFIGAVLNDSDGVVNSVQLFANGTLVGTVNSPQQGQVLTYNANNAGRFNLYAVATDDTGNTSVSSPAIVINVTAVNAPTTTITRPTDNSTTATVGSPVFLEGTAVNTSTTQVPTMQFIATAGGGSRTTINGIRVGTTTTYRAIWTPVNPDTYTMTTQASVGVVQGTSTTSRRVVVTEIVGLAPTVTLTRAPGVSGVPTTATTASTADFCATATDPDGSVVEVEFFLNRNSVGLARKDPQGNTWRVTASFAGLLPGLTEVVALARDNSGNIVASPTSNINVVAASSIAPSIAITPSTTNPAFNRAVQLRANARDSDGTVTSVQYFANATSIATSTNAGSLFLTSWTPADSGLYRLWALATDNSGITRVSDTLELNVRRNNPVLENSAFILQTYQDIANTTNINPLVFDQLDEQLGNGTLTRADIIVSPLTANGGVALTDLAGFQPPVNLLAIYYVLMGHWPTPQNYTNFLATARNSLPAAVTGILNANEFFAKYGVVPTTQLLDNPNSVLPVDTFLRRLHVSAGIRPPEPLDIVTFRSNNALSATRGRGYAVVGLSSAIAEFVTNTNSTNTALFARARAAALFYQLARPPVTMSVDEITARIDALLRLPTSTAIADAVLKDILYGYRYVTITRHPQSLVVAPGSGALFSVEAQGAPPLVYQWLLNGAPIPGATNALLSVTNADVGRVGSYTVAITSNAATATSDAATLTLSNTPTRLANIATRGVTGGGADVLIAGFVVRGANANQARQMLIRVVGPRLSAAPFNLTGVLANPRLEVYQGNNPTPVLTNDDWGTQAGGAAQVTAIVQATNRAGAFTLQNNSQDAVVLATLPPGLFTVQAKGPANAPNATGVVLIEVYDVTANAAAPGKAGNLSTRGFVGTGSNTLIAGFVVNGGVSRRILIRGAGPALARLGVPGTLADPLLTLVDQTSGRTVAVSDNWSTGEEAAIIASAASAAGAFPFPSESRDSALLVMLAPGAYTAQLSGVGNTTGIGIVEVYDVDP